MTRSLFWRCLQVVARLFTTLYFDLKVYGKENVPKDGPAPLVANHQSYLDPVLVAVQLTRPVGYMARSGLFEGSKFFNWLIRELHAFPVRQGEGDIGAIRETVRRLEEGHLINLYPEGARTWDGEIGHIQPGVGLIVRKAHVPVIPVAITGSHEAWKRGTPMFRAAKIRVTYGKPIEVKGLKGTQIVEKIETTLKKMYEEIRHDRE